MIRDSKQPAGCFSLRWTQEYNIRGGTERNGTEPDTHNYLHRYFGSPCDYNVTLGTGTRTWNWA